MKTTLGCIQLCPYSNHESRIFQRLAIIYGYRKLLLKEVRDDGIRIDAVISLLMLLNLESEVLIELVDFKVLIVVICHKYSRRHVCNMRTITSDS